MKKLVLIILLSLSAFTAQGQKIDGYGIPSHSLDLQVSDGMGEGAVAVFAQVLAVSIQAIFNQTSETEFVGWIPYVTTGYNYHFADTRWSMGAELGYWHLAARDNKDNVVTTTHGNVGTVALSGKCFYKPKGVCKLYGGLNLGLGTYWVMEDSPEGRTFENPQFFPAFQLNPIGMRLGSEKIAFIAELGLGYRGILQLGVNIGL